jgi:hypothetical protein
MFEIILKESGYDTDRICAKINSLRYIPQRNVLNHHFTGKYLARHKSILREIEDPVISKTPVPHTNL